MCRMLAIISKNPIPASFVNDFRLLAEKGKVLPSVRESGHKDGWGIVVYQEGIPIYLGRQPTNAMQDRGYVKACEHLNKASSRGPLLAHLRKASPEYKGKIMENTAPFVKGRWCFAHNGTIHNFTEEVVGLKGTTDSERLFLLLLREKEDSELSIERVLERTIKKLRALYRYSSLTFLLSNGIRIYAYREYSNPQDSDYYNLMYATDEKHSNRISRGDLV